MAAAEATRGEQAWLNGRVISCTDLSLPVGDAGFVLGTTVTEQFRTFRGRLFLPEDHGRRLAESLAVVGIASPWSITDLLAAATDIAAHNWRLAGSSSDAAPDLAVVMFVTPGDLPAQHAGYGGPPRGVIHTFPLACALWAEAYDHGVSLRSVSVAQVPEACWPLRAKVRSRLHYHLADREAHQAEPGSRAVLAHADGRISETSTANIAIVRAGCVTTPPLSDALGGVSLGNTKRLAASLGIAWEERSLTATDLAAADEILLTSTPSCLLPATRFNGRPVGTGKPGPVFRALLDAWSSLVGIDIAAQARRLAADSRRTPPATTL